MTTTTRLAFLGTGVHRGQTPGPSSPHAAGSSPRARTPDRARRGRQIVAEYFDIRQISFPSRRRARPSGPPRSLRRSPTLTADSRPVVVGSRSERFSTATSSATPSRSSAHYGVPLWVPEVGRTDRPGQPRAHDLIMVGCFGGVLEGRAENRIKIRVRTAIGPPQGAPGRVASLAGGRPLNGYKFGRWLGPHPNPAKAVDRQSDLHAPGNRRLRPPGVVERIYGPVSWTGHGLPGHRRKHLTRDGIPCPSAHDPRPQTSQPQRHRLGPRAAVPAPSSPNPRYTGPAGLEQAAAKTKCLIDVSGRRSPAHTTKMRWNDGDQWIYSEKVVHPVCLGQRRQLSPKFSRCSSARSGQQHKPHRSRHDYRAAGPIGSADCATGRMQGPLGPKRRNRITGAVSPLSTCLGPTRVQQPPANVTPPPRDAIPRPPRQMALPGSSTARHLAPDH